MTTPTQAQILNLRRQNTKLRNELRKLTAAAQVKDSARLQQMIAGNAAAQIGEQWKPDIHGTKAEIWNTAVAHTIERCAQVADKYADRSSTAAAIAEDIRKLKDE